MLLAFVFVLIGFGTKTGLFPMHAWLPDAHSEAPSPVSALLSAVLLNCALLVMIRYYIIICQAIGSDFPNRLLLIFGMLSVAVAAFFILVQRDIKRLLAYSSVENMGLVAVALGIGGPLGIFAALLHTLNHSLAKTLLFCGSGNVLLKYGTRDLNVVCGMLKIMPFTAVLFGGGALALGINSGAYVSEIIRGGLMAVDPGQMEAGRSLGLNYITTMVVIIIPQAIRAVLPALGNEFIMLLKDTSLITVIGGKELLYAAQGIMNRTYEAMFPLFGVALIYLVLVMIFTWLLAKFERRLAQSDR